VAVHGHDAIPTPGTDAAAISAMVDRTPFCLHLEHGDSKWKTSGKQREAGAHPSGTIPAKVEK
jgi:hypothetical protein